MKKNTYKTRNCCQSIFFVFLFFIICTVHAEAKVSSKNVKEVEIGHDSLTEVFSTKGIIDPNKYNSLNRVVNGDSPKINVTPVSIPKGGSGSLLATTGPHSVTKFTGLWDIYRDPLAINVEATKDDMGTCEFAANGGRTRYTATKFRVSVSGAYNFIMEQRPEYSGAAYIYTGDFTPGYCDRGGQWIIGLGSFGRREPEFKPNLVAGVEYTLISVVTPFIGDYSIWDYTWRVEPPRGGEFLLDTLIYWYKSSSGGEPLGWGPSFNPVGVEGSGLANTNTPGTTTYYASYASVAGDAPRVPVNFVINDDSPKIDVTPVSICKGGSGLLSAKSVAHSVTGFMGLWNIEKDPFAFTPTTTRQDMYTCKFEPFAKSRYTATKFTVSLSGEYNFKMKNRSEYVGSAYIYSGNFTPGYCDRGGKWIVGLGPEDTEPELKANLDAGVEYTLISVFSPYTGDTNMWDYAWTVEPPKGGEFILDDLIYWYKSSTGGEPLGWGPTFNPVGVKGSGLADTNTPGITTYYAAYASSTGDTPRFPVNFVIKEDAIAGVPSIKPTLYVNNVMPDITHTTIDAVGIKDSGVSGANGLPKGVSAVWEANKITIVGTPIVSGVFNYKIPLIGGCGNIYAEGKIIVNDRPKIEVEPVNICKGDSGLLSAKSAAYSVTRFMGLWNKERDPFALMPTATKDDMYTCKFETKGESRYTATKFTVSVSGEYNFKMEDRSEYAGHAYIYSGDFTPGYCDRGGQWIVGVGSYPGKEDVEPEFKANFEAGVEYTLISVFIPYDGDANMYDYTWRVEPPVGGEFILDNLIYWYKSSTGGEPLGWGPTFNPVGVEGSGLADTNTAGTTTYYAAYASSSGDAPRFPVNFVIKEDAIAGVPSIKPTLYVNNVMPDITHTTIDAVGIKDSGVSGANGLPKGVSAVWEVNKITIVGTPIVSGVFNYKIPLIGGCGNIYAEGKIIVNDRPKIEVEPVNICKGDSGLLSAKSAAYSVTRFMGLWNKERDPF
ncbi:hypothetical protein, partial [Flavobacterium sp. AJR]|uniref:hypothetical protein n=1 Tax=Flavobacterium sp. AJR TaxID=1979369 RepID=UPI000B6340E6